MQTLVRKISYRFHRYSQQETRGPWGNNWYDDIRENPEIARERLTINLLGTMRLRIRYEDENRDSTLTLDNNKRFVRFLGYTENSTRIATRCNSDRGRGIFERACFAVGRDFVSRKTMTKIRRKFYLRTIKQVLRHELRSRVFFLASCDNEKCTSG